MQAIVKIELPDDYTGYGVYMGNERKNYTKVPNHKDTGTADPEWVLNNPMFQNIVAVGYNKCLEDLGL